MNVDRAASPLGRGLLDLKERGCSLLVVNEAGGVDAVCNRLGGLARHGRRRCYVPTTTTLPSVLDRHAPSPRRGAYLGVVDATTAGSVRGTATPIQPGYLDVEAEWYTRLEDLADLPELARLIETHLDRFAERGGPLDPGEVRLCIESLDPFLDDPEVDAADLRAFLDSVTTLVRGRTAIGHFHVSPGAVPEVQPALESYFDATVRIRTADGGTVQQRWWLRDADLETDWLPLDARESGQ